MIKKWWTSILAHTAGLYAVAVERREIRRILNPLTSRGYWYYARGRLNAMVQEGHISNLAAAFVHDEIVKGLTAAMDTRFVVQVKVEVLDQVEFVHGYDIDILAEEAFRTADPTRTLDKIEVREVIVYKDGEPEASKISGYMSRDDLRKELVTYHISSVEENSDIHKPLKLKYPTWELAKIYAQELMIQQRIDESEKK